MKPFKLFVFCLLLFSVNSFSQYNNDYYNDSRYSGVNRNIGRENRNNTKPSAEEMEKEKLRQIDKIVARLKEDLTLDELQTIAIKNEITSNSKNIDVVLKKEDSDENKTKEIKALMDRLQIVITSYLNKDQKEKYKELISGNKNSKKNKKEKKQDKTTEE